MRGFRALIIAAFLAASVAPAAVAAGQLNGQQTYDLLFKNGTLDDIPHDKTLVYHRQISNTLKPEAAKRDSGYVMLSYAKDDPTMVALKLQQDDKFRGLGEFPASVGNPMIMYFYESVVRDMAEATGGNAFYIRNRIKEALIRPNESEDGQTVFHGEPVPTQTVHMRPFADDPNRDRMQGFENLELVITMSEQVPGWYLDLSAEAGEVYETDLRFERLEDAE